MLIDDDIVVWLCRQVCYVPMAVDKRLNELSGMAPYSGLGLNRRVIKVFPERVRAYEWELAWRINYVPHNVSQKTYRILFRFCAAKCGASMSFHNLSNDDIGDDDIGDDLDYLLYLCRQQPHVYRMAERRRSALTAENTALLLAQLKEAYS